MLRSFVYLMVNLLIRILKFNKVIVDFKSNISYKLLGKTKLRGTKSFPIIIKGSTVGDLVAGEGCKIINSSVSHKVKLGNHVSINGPATRVSASIEGIEIGSFTSIASNVVIQEYYHRYDRISSYYIFQNIFKESVEKDIYSKGKIIIEEDVWIGSNSTILSGIKIGRGSIVAAGSVVTKDVPRYSIVAGNPAKIIRARFNDQVIDLLEASKWWTWKTEKIIKNKNLFIIENPELIESELKSLL